MQSLRAHLVSLCGEVWVWNFDECLIHLACEHTSQSKGVVYGWTLGRLITACLCVSGCACMFTPAADGGICAECRPAESLLRQRQAGGRAGRCRRRAAGGCAAVTMEEAVAHISLPEHRWRWTGRHADKGETESANNEDRPQPAQEMGPRGQDHTYTSGTRECDSATMVHAWSDLWRTAGTNWFYDGPQRLFLVSLVLWFWSEGSTITEKWHCCCKMIIWNPKYFWCFQCVRSWCT